MCEFTGISVQNFPENGIFIHPHAPTNISTTFAVWVCDLSVRYSGDLQRAFNSIAHRNIPPLAHVVQCM